MLAIAVKRKDGWLNLASVANALLIFHAENATVERGFSLPSRLRNPTRNRLLTASADRLMRLRLHTSSYKSNDYDKEYLHWLKSFKHAQYCTNESINNDHKVVKELNDLVID